MEMFYEFFEFQKRLMKIMINPPMRSSKKAVELSTVNFYPSRPETG